MKCAIDVNAKPTQEDPFKLVIVAKDVHRLGVMTADFLFASNGEFYIAVSDEEGVIRLLEYDPEGRSSACSASIANYNLLHHRPRISKWTISSATHGVPHPGRKSFNCSGRPTIASGRGIDPSGKTHHRYVYFEDSPRPIYNQTHILYRNGGWLNVCSDARGFRRFGKTIAATPRSTHTKYAACSRSEPSGFSVCLVVVCISKGCLLIFIQVLCAMTIWRSRLQRGY